MENKQGHTFTFIAGMALGVGIFVYNDKAKANSWWPYHNQHLQGLPSPQPQPQPINPSGLKWMEGENDKPNYIGSVTKAGNVFDGRIDMLIPSQSMIQVSWKETPVNQYDNGIRRSVVRLKEMPGVMMGGKMHVEPKVKDIQLLRILESAPLPPNGARPSTLSIDGLNVKQGDKVQVKILKDISNVVPNKMISYS